MAEPDPSLDEDAAMRERLTALGRDLGTGQGAAPKTSATGVGGMGSAVNLGARVLSEFVAAVAVSAFIGWELDRWLGTPPLLLILFIALGTAAGFWTVYRVAAKPSSR